VRVNLLSQGRAAPTFSANCPQPSGPARCCSRRAGRLGGCSGCQGGRGRSQLRGQLRHDPIATSARGGALTSLVQGRARATFSHFRNSQGRAMLLERSGRWALRGCGRRPDALSYGVSFATTRSQPSWLGGRVNSLVKVAAARDLIRIRNSQGRRDAARGDRAAWGCSGCGRRPQTLSVRVRS